MRRKLSLGGLLFAWLCANGALWNVVQVVAWARMYHDYSQAMPAAQALRITLDGSAPCALCRITQQARDAAREQLPREAVPGGTTEKLLLVSEAVTPFVVSAPDFSWPEAGPGAGRTRTGSVPVPPPRV